MDDQRFDAFAKRWATGLSLPRRNVLALIVGSIVTFGTGRKEAAAEPGKDNCQDKPGGHCTQHIPCCHGTCNDGGTCGCAKPEVECNEHCIDPKRFESDDANCGACGKFCPKGYACCGGKCTLVMGNDPKNCGSCGETCAGDCREGICQCLKKNETCKSDAECCTGNCFNGRCGCAGFGMPGCYDCCAGQCSDVACKGCNKTGGACQFDADCCLSEKDGSPGVCVKGTCFAKA